MRETLVECGCQCPGCARSIAGPVSVLCRVCAAAGDSPFDTLNAPYEYGGQLAVALKRLKYSQRSDVARALAPLLLPHFEESRRRCEAAVAVPLHRRRLMKRGYNQSERLLHHLGRVRTLPLLPSALRRIRHTAEQSSLPASERQRNVSGAFRATSAVSGLRLLLVDDISTTGHTMRAAALALRRAGAREVHAFCVARTPIC